MKKERIIVSISACIAVMTVIFSCREPDLSDTGTESEWLSGGSQTAQGTKRKKTERTQAMNNNKKLAGKIALITGGSSGLGLAIVGRIIETHRGTVRIKSKIGHGTSIVIMLPMQ